MNKFTEFQTLMNDVLPSAEVIFNPYVHYVRNREQLCDKLETEQSRISFTIPGKKTMYSMTKQQLSNELRGRYSVADDDPKLLAILVRMDEHKATRSAEILAEYDQEQAAQAEVDAVVAQFPKNIGEYELMCEILRLRAGETSTIDAQIIEQLRHALAELQSRYERRGAYVDELEVRVDEAECGERAAQALTRRVLEQLDALHSAPEVEPLTDDEVDDLLASLAE